jgi:hypothetical protein
MKSFYFPVLLLLVCSCKTQKVEFSQIIFEADACFGTCPIFTMTIAGDGTAHYNAKMYNDKQGEFNAVIKHLQIDSLNQLIEKSDLLSLKNEYSSNWTDQPTYTLTVKLNNGQTKTISDYGPNGPEKLKDLYHLIFSLRQSQDWK